MCQWACVSEQEKCGGQRPVFRRSSGAIILKQGLSLSLEITDEASIAASEPRYPPVSGSLELTSRPRFFLIWTVEINSGPWVCKESTLKTKPSLQPES